MRHENIFLSVLEFLIFITMVVFMSWFMQSKSKIINQIDEPKVLSVTEDYIDVRWHNYLQLDCPLKHTPIFFTALATESLPTLTAVESVKEQIFIRRYFFPEHLVQLHKEYSSKDVTYFAELRIVFEAECNPLWNTQEVFRIPFKMIH